MRRIGGGDVLQDKGDEGESEGQPPSHQVVHSEPPQLGPAGEKRVNLSVYLQKINDIFSLLKVL